MYLKFMRRELGNSVGLCDLALCPSGKYLVLIFSLPEP